MEILGADGKIIGGVNKIDVCGFSFKKELLDANPILTIITMMMLDPSEKQIEFATAMDLKLTDSFGKQIFPKEKEEDEGNEDDN